MTWILELVSKSGQLIFWFISAVIIPVTVWFTLVRSDLTNVKAQQIEDRMYIASVDEKVDDFKETNEDNMKKIIQDLGIIKGELKRIK